MSKVIINEPADDQVSYAQLDTTLWWLGDEYIFVAKLSRQIFVSFFKLGQKYDFPLFSTSRNQKVIFNVKSSQKSQLALSASFEYLCYDYTAFIRFI